MRYKIMTAVVLLIGVVLVGVAALFASVQTDQTRLDAPDAVETPKTEVDGAAAE